ncbi:MAG: helix-turn-helix domain-containing protein [Clostridiales bacterium]|nr:helix-turn-helix domain-containing protein [Clostridiales bacterium]
MNDMNAAKAAKLAPMWETAATYTGPRLQKIIPASEITGLSPSYIRNGCKAGKIKHIISGRSYYVDMPWLLQQIDDGTLRL